VSAGRAPDPSEERIAPEESDEREKTSYSKGLGRRTGRSGKGEFQGSASGTEECAAASASLRINVPWEICSTRTAEK